MQASLSLLKPPPKLTIPEWADRYRYLGESNAEPGRWRTSRVPYQREPAECITDPKVRRVSLMWAAQTGKTEGLLNNPIGYFISQDPKSMIVMHPTKTDLQAWAVGKLNPLLEQTEVVRDRVAKPRARDGVNNQSMKSYPGGYLYLVFSGSPSQLRGKSVPIILCDEIDGYEYTEGHAINLLWQRAATFGDRAKLIETSTPTDRDKSAIEKAFLAGDQRYYWVPCPHCDEFQRLHWKNVEWDKLEDGTHLAHTARYRCDHCEELISDGDKLNAIARGEWRAEKDFYGHASFHLNELYSPFRNWQDIVQSFLDKKHSGDLRSFVNVSLAETWWEKGEAPDWRKLYDRREPYPHGIVPKHGLLLTAAVDIQQDRIEVEVKAWGRFKENWSVEHIVIPGDFTEQSVKDQLTQILETEYRHEVGLPMRIERMGVDSGYNTQEVYTWCRSQSSSRVMALRGQDKQRTILTPPKAVDINLQGKRARRAIQVWNIGVSVLKEELYRLLKLDPPTDEEMKQGACFPPGYCHFPTHYQDEWFRQLCSEQLIEVRTKRGFIKHEWEKLRERNEALDLHNYNRAVASAIGIDRFSEKDWDRLERGLRINADPEEKQNRPRPRTTTETSKPRARRKSTFWS